MCRTNPWILTHLFCFLAPLLLIVRIGFCWFRYRDDPLFSFTCRRAQCSLLPVGHAGGLGAPPHGSLPGPLAGGRTTAHSHPYATPGSSTLPGRDAAVWLLTLAPLTLRYSSWKFMFHWTHSINRTAFLKIRQNNFV